MELNANFGILVLGSMSSGTEEGSAAATLMTSVEEDEGLWNETIEG